MAKSYSADDVFCSRSYSSRMRNRDIFFTALLSYPPDCKSTNPETVTKRTMHINDFCPTEGQKI